MAHKAVGVLRPDFKSEIHLLIVQRNQLLARSLARYLSAHYARVVVASTTGEAEARLQSGVGIRWHVICGQMFESGPEGISCLSRWRAEFPAIARAILATGCDAVEPLPAGVDGSFHKPNDPRELLALLQVHNRSTTPTELHLASTNKDTMTSTKIKTHDLKTLKDRTSTTAASKATPASMPKVAQGFTMV
jgi:DNA-binding response OmpR family regulator